MDSTECETCWYYDYDEEYDEYYCMMDLDEDEVYRIANSPLPALPLLPAGRRLHPCKETIDETMVSRADPAVPAAGGLFREGGRKRRSPPRRRPFPWKQRRLPGCMTRMTRWKCVTATPCGRIP
ncbi:MAG: DUF6472 family protein [Oscillospiraceae bacterium]